MQRYKQALLAIIVMGIPQGHASISGYADVDTRHTNHAAIGHMHTVGLMTGYADGTFQPDRAMNRAELIKLLVTVQFDPRDVQMCLTDFTLEYTDITGEEWFAPAVCMATREGLVQGFPDGRFGGAEPVTTAQGIKMIALATGAAPQASAPWYAPYVTYLTTSNALPLDLPFLTEPLPRRHVAEILWRIDLQHTKAASVENTQTQSEFFDALTEAQVMANSRPKTELLAAEPVAHMDCSEAYFRKKAASPEVQDMLTSLNAFRSAHDAQPLILNDEISCQVQIHAQRIVDYDFFEHTTPAGRTARMRMDKTNIPVVFFGENIVRGVFSGQEGIDKWAHQHSPDGGRSKHYYNALDPVYDMVGIGVMPDAEFGGFLYVVLFGQSFPEEYGPMRINTEASPAEGPDGTVPYEELVVTEQ